ncbi:MAG: MFS transporter [Bacteroidales bacterium]|nr:MFS transporter [Lachnoclostridium sp.]MCM1383145.1 MFS transporter [Lachnoclostridium sp.]MCM1465363.1 MFS transporter [Bacteroidales bacterium]
MDTSEAGLQKGKENEKMGYLKTASEKKQLCFTYLAFMLNGVLALSIGSLLPFIRETKGLNYAFAGMLVSLHSVGNLCSSFASGTFAVFLGRKKSILLFDACYALSYVLILFGNSSAALVIAFLMTGLARGASSNFANYTVNSLAPGKAGFLNALHAMFSIGALAFPVFLMLLTRTDAGRWVYACYFMIAMGILSWILYFLIPEDKPRTDTKEKEADSDKKSGFTAAGFGFFREPLFYLCTLTLFFYLCAEQGVIGWLITYFEDTGLLSASLSQLMASIQWIMMLAGRLTAAKLSEKFRKEKLLLIMGIGFVCFFFWLLFAGSTLFIIIGIMGFGYSMAGIYPTTVSFCGSLIQKYSIAWSFILTIASFGSILMPAIIGRLAESKGLAYGMSSVVVVVIIDLLLIIALNCYVKQKSR